MKDQLIPMGLYLIASLVGAVGQYCYKLGSSRLNSIPVYLNAPLLAGVALFGLVMVLFVLSFKLGGRLTVVYPIYATTFIWGTLLGVWLDGEPISIPQLASIGLIVIGAAGVAVFAPH